jgi:hypothetical protein
MYRMIVRRGDPEWYDVLYRTFNERLPVIWERRKRERRKPSPTLMEERRRAERRGPVPTSWASLGFVVVRVPRQS